MDKLIKSNASDDALYAFWTIYKQKDCMPDIKIGDQIIIETLNGKYRTIIDFDEPTLKRCQDYVKRCQDYVKYYHNNN